jgi:hypothetical protein
VSCGGAQKRSNPVASKTAIIIVVKRNVPSFTFSSLTDFSSLIFSSFSTLSDKALLRKLVDSGYCARADQKNVVFCELMDGAAVVVVVGCLSLTNSH